MLKNLRRALLFVFRSTCAIKKLNYEKASVYIIRHSTNSSKMVRVLNVAEKNDAAKSIAEIMCNGRFRRREGRSVYNKIYEFEYNLFNQRCQMVMTSVSGHLLNLEFAGSYRKWQWCNPVTLFDAPVVIECLQDYQPIKATLEAEAKKCHYLIIWTDCDREGENIGFEIIDVCKKGNALDDLSIDDINVEASLNRELINDTGNSSISGIGGSSLLGASAPVNIPCSGDIHDRGLPNLSPPVTSPLGSLSHSLQLGSSSLTQTDHSLDKAAAAFYGHSGSFTNSKFHYPGSSLYDFAAPQNMSPSNRMGTQQSLVPSIGAFNSLGSSNLSEIQRLRDEFATNRLKMPWDDGTIQARSVYQTYEVWKREAEEASRRERLAEQQRDEVVFYQTATKCMICEDKNRSITVVPCSHYVLCNQCAPHQKNCPYCHEAITSLSNASL